MTFVMNFVKRPVQPKHCLDCGAVIEPNPGSYRVSNNRKWCNSCASKQCTRKHEHVQRQEGKHEHFK